MKADALAATLALPSDTNYQFTVATRLLFCPKYSLEVSEVHKTSTNFEPRDWRFLIIDLRFAWHTARWSQGSGFCSTKIYLILLRCSGEDVYRRSYDGILLHCLSSSKAREVLKEAHDGICRAHQSGPKFKDRLHRLGYYWPTMITDAIEYARRCKDCQIHANFIRQPLELLHPTVVSWPIEAWEIDVVGPISPSSAKGHQLILTIIDYFSNWAKVASFPEVKTTYVVNFIKHHVIYRFGVPSGSSMTMVPNLRANRSISSATVPDSECGLNCLQPYRQQVSRSVQ